MVIMTIIVAIVMVIANGSWPNHWLHIAFITCKWKARRNGIVSTIINKYNKHLAGREVWPCCSGRRHWTCCSARLCSPWWGDRPEGRWSSPSSRPPRPGWCRIGGYGAAKSLSACWAETGEAGEGCGRWRPCGTTWMLTWSSCGSHDDGLFRGSSSPAGNLRMLMMMTSVFMCQWSL